MFLYEVLTGAVVRLLFGWEECSPYSFRDRKFNCWPMHWASWPFLYGLSQYLLVAAFVRFSVGEFSSALPCELAWLPILSHTLLLVLLLFRLAYSPFACHPLTCTFLACSSSELSGLLLWWRRRDGLGVKPFFVYQEPPLIAGSRGLCLPCHSSKVRYF